MATTKKYTVVGIYEDDGQRWCDSFDAESPEDAEEQAEDAYPGVTIAGTFEGDLTPVL